MRKTQSDIADDHEVLMQMVLELTRAAIEAGEMNDEVAELVCDFERVLAINLGLKNPPQSLF